MQRSKIYNLQAIITSFFIFNSTLSFAANTENTNTTHAPIAIGTYVHHDDIKQTMLIKKNKNGSWSFINTIQNANNGGYLYNVMCTNNLCISTGAIETKPDHWHKRPLFMESIDEGHTWFEKDIFGLPSMKDGAAPYMSCVTNMCTAVGWYQSNNGNTLPLLLMSNDEGQSWSYMQNIAHLPEKMRYGALDAITCQDQFCIAGGIYNMQTNHDQPLFLISSDRGQSWSFISKISDLPEIANAFLEFIKCNSKVCVAVGTYTTHPKNNQGPYDPHVLLLISKDKGQSWNFVKELPELNDLDQLDIEDLNYTNGSFIAVGGYHKARQRGFTRSLILISNDEGQSWSLKKNILGSESIEPGWLKSISCTDNQCIAGGYDVYTVDGEARFGLTLLVSKNNGESWSLIPSIPGVPYNTDIDVVHCLESHCLAIGKFSDGFEYSHPVIIESDDKGQSWSVVKDIVNFPENIYYVHFSSATSN